MAELYGLPSSHEIDFKRRRPTSVTPSGARVVTTGTKTPKYKGAFAKLANLRSLLESLACLVSEVQP